MPDADSLLIWQGNSRPERFNDGDDLWLWRNNETEYELVARAGRGVEVRIEISTETVLEMANRVAGWEGANALHRRAVPPQ